MEGLTDSPNAQAAITSAAETGWRRPQTFTSHRSAGWKCKIEAPVDLILGVDSSWLADSGLAAVCWPGLCLVHAEERVREPALWRLSSARALTPPRGPHPHGLT